MPRTSTNNYPFASAHFNDSWLLRIERDTKSSAQYMDDFVSIRVHLPIMRRVIVHFQNSHGLTSESLKCKARLVFFNFSRVVRSYVDSAPC
jgi:hypothetical protein